jgi:hypothetical protein
MAAAEVLQVSGGRFCVCQDQAMICSAFQLFSGSAFRLKMPQDDLEGIIYAGGRCGLLYPSAEYGGRALNRNF